MVKDGRQHVFRDGDFVLKDVAYHAFGRQQLELDGIGACARQVQQARQITLGLLLAVAQRDHRIDALARSRRRTQNDVEYQGSAIVALPGRAPRRA